MAFGFAGSLDVRQLPAVLLLLAGIVLAGYGAYDYQQQSDALEDTVTVNATITETDVRTDISSGNQDYVPEATFDYRYQDTSYTSNNIFPSGSTPHYDTEAKANEAIEGYEEGETVTAYVNPSSPSRAFLTERRSEKPFTLVAVGGFTTLVAGVHLFRSS